MKVLFNTSYPWLLGLFYRCSAREDVWVQFKYERLSEFYFMCGRLRDVSLNCIMSAFKRVAPNIFGPLTFLVQKCGRNLWHIGGILLQTLGLGMMVVWSTLPLLIQILPWWNLVIRVALTCTTSSFHQCDVVGAAICWQGQRVSWFFGRTFESSPPASMQVMAVWTKECPLDTCSRSQVYTHEVLQALANWTRLLRAG